MKKEWTRVNSSENFWEWIAKRKRAIIIFTVLITCIIIFSQQAIVIIDVRVTDNQNGEATLGLLNNNGVRSGVFRIGPVAFVPRDTGRIEATFNNWQTTTDISPLPWLGFKSVDITIDPDKNATKISGASLGCTAFDKKSQVVASYSCSDPSGLSTYKTSDKNEVQWSNEAYLSFPRAYFVSPYKDGLLGISNNKSPQLFYADMNSKTVDLPTIPAGMTPDEFRSTSIVTDQTKDTNHFLLISTQKGVIYFATDNGNKDIEYRRFTINQEWYDSKAVNCVLRDTVAHCYIGWPTFDIHSDDEDEAHEEARNDGRVVSIDFTTDKVAYSISMVSKNEPIDNLFVDGNNNIYSISGNNLYSLDISKSTSLRTITAAPIGNVSNGPTLYYISNNKLYEFDSKTKQTKLRFFSKHLRLSTVNQIDSRVFFNAYVEGDPGRLLHTYELTNDSNSTPNERLIDKLPIYPDNDQSNIVRMDINNNNIHIVLPSYVTLNSSEDVIPDEKAYTTSKQEAINYLSTKIPNLSTYKITFSRAEK